MWHVAGTQWLWQQCAVRRRGGGLLSASHMLVLSSFYCNSSSAHGYSSLISAARGRNRNRGRVSRCHICQYSSRVRSQGNTLPGTPWKHPGITRLATDPDQSLVIVGRLVKPTAVIVVGSRKDSLCLVYVPSPPSIGVVVPFPRVRVRQASRAGRQPSPPARWSGAPRPPPR